MRKCNSDKLSYYVNEILLFTFTVNCLVLNLYLNEKIIC